MMNRNVEIFGKSKIEDWHLRNWQRVFELHLQRVSCLDSW